MKNLNKALNDSVERLFQAALRRNSAANFIVNLAKYISPSIYAIWLFRKGDISNSYEILKRKQNKGLFKKCADRSKHILQELEKALPWNTPRNVKHFNGNILFAVHSIGNHYANGYAHRTALISESLTKMGFNIFGVTRPGYPWDLSKTANLPRVMNSSFGQVNYTHFYDEKSLISDAEDKYIDLYTEQLANYAGQKECTVIHAHSSYINGIAASRAAKKQGILSVYEMRGLWHLSRAVKEPLFEDTDHYRYIDKMEITAAILCDKVVTLNKSLKKWLISKGVDANKISIVPNGINALPSRPCGKKQDGFTIGFLGSITEYEGIENVIDAIRLLQREKIKVFFEIYGDGAYRSTLEKKIRRLNLSQEVIFKGRVSKSELTDVYDKLDTVVVTRKALQVTELVTPLKLVEAMMMSKPCIVSDLPALREVVEHNKTALVVKPDSPQEIANAINYLFNNPEHAYQLSRNALHAASNQFNWQNSVKTYLSIYGN